MVLLLRPILLAAALSSIAVPASDRPFRFDSLRALLSPRRSQTYERLPGPTSPMSDPGRSFQNGFSEEEVRAVAELHQVVAVADRRRVHAQAAYHAALERHAEEHTLQTLQRHAASERRRHFGYSKELRNAYQPYSARARQELERRVQEVLAAERAHGTPQEPTSPHPP